LCLLNVDEIAIIDIKT